MSTTTTTTTTTTTGPVPILPNTASIDEIVASIAVAGGCIIKNAVSHEDIDVIE